MKKLSFMAVLAVSTILIACSSDSSGGGTSFVSGNGGGGSSIPVTSLPDGSTVPESGTSIQTVNNSQRRTANYENAVESVSGTASGIAVLASALSAGNATAEEINNAYSNMNKILVNQDFTNATKEDILLSLAMAGEDISDLKEKTLDELKAEVQNSDIKSKAEDVYARLGTERNLSLKDITFYEPGDTNRDVYTFIVDTNGNLTGFKQGDEANATNLKFTRTGDGIYKANEGLIKYGFVYKGEYGTTYEEDVTFSKSTPISEIREALKKTAQAEWSDSSELNALLAWLDTVDLSNPKADDEDCDNQNTCVYKKHSGNNITAQLDSVGKTIALKYTDFGSIKYDVDGEKDVNLFYGGYEALSAKASDLPQVDTEMNFEGKALAKVETEVGDDDISKLYNGTANLTFKDGKETLVADFTDWHKVTIETDGSKPSGYAFTFDKTPTDTNLTVPFGGQEAVDIKYYGENPKNPDEFAGSAFYEQGDFNAEMVFGGTRK